VFSRAHLDSVILCVDSRFEGSVLFDHIIGRKELPALSGLVFYDAKLCRFCFILEFQSVAPAI
jgi:hypothetical protein